MRLPHLGLAPRHPVSQSLAAGVVMAAVAATLAMAIPAATARGDGPPLGQTQPSTRPSTRPIGPTPLADKVCESKAIGISLRVPEGCLQKTVTGIDAAMAFVDDDRNWTLEVGMQTFAKPQHMGPWGTPSKPHNGVLNDTVIGLQKHYHGCTVLRADLTNLGSNPVGMATIRYSKAAGHLLLQTAIIQANDELYYFVTMTTPARSDLPELDDQGHPMSVDPDEAAAVVTFRHVLDSVKLLDRAPVRHDQEFRLYRTRALFTLVTAEQLKSALIPRRWMRIRHKDKDIGYRYVVEMNAAGLPKPLTQRQRDAGQTIPDVLPGDGVLIGQRSRIRPDYGPHNGKIVDSETWMYVSADRKHEEWTTVQDVIDPRNQGKPDGSVIDTEFGIYDQRIKIIPVVISSAQGDIRDQQTVDVSKLTVNHIGHGVDNTPIERTPPIFYAPKAYNYLLPRLAFTQVQKAHFGISSGPDNFLVAAYVSDLREVMLRYIDVSKAHPVQFDGKNISAVTINERYGLAGPVTTYYLSPDGAYLGKIDEALDISTTVSDQPTLERIWEHVDLPSHGPASGAPEASRDPAPGGPPAASEQR